MAENYNESTLLIRYELVMYVGKKMVRCQFFFVPLKTPKVTSNDFRITLNLLQIISKMASKISKIHEKIFSISSHDHLTFPINTSKYESRSGKTAVKVCFQLLTARIDLSRTQQTHTWKLLLKWYLKCT